MESRGASANLPNLPHSLHLLDHGVHRFFASIELILVVRVHETLCGAQYLIDLAELPLLRNDYSIQGQRNVNRDKNRRRTIVRANQLSP